MLGLLTEWASERLHPETKKSRQNPQGLSWLSRGSPDMSLPLHPSDLLFGEASP